MKKIPICILCLFLALGVKVQGMTLYSTYDNNSTEGNYFGALYFSFSSTNSGDYQPFSGNPAEATWSSTGNIQTFTDPISGAQIELSFEAGLAEAPDELNFLSNITVNDPAMGSLAGSLGGHDEKGGSFQVGQPKAFTYTSQLNSYYYSFTLNTGGTCNFGYSLTGNFDGTSGSAVGSWYLNYTVPQITPAPEPAVTLQVALGGFCLWLARARRQRRK